MLMGFAASPFDELLGHCAYNRSQLMLFFVSLHANVSATPPHSDTKLTSGSSISASSQTLNECIDANSATAAQTQTFHTCFALCNYWEIYRR